MTCSLNSNVQNDKQFSVAKTVSSAAIGAGVCRLGHDIIMRNCANSVLNTLTDAGADTFIRTNNYSKESVLNTINASKDVLKNTEYLNNLKTYITSPLRGLDAFKESLETLTTNVISGKYIKNIKSKCSSIKNTPLKENAAKVFNCIKDLPNSTKGMQKLALIIGAAGGMALLGTKETKEEKAKRNFIKPTGVITPVAMAPFTLQKTKENYFS